MRWSTRNITALLLYGAIVTGIAFMSYQKPSYNWDTLAYMAIILNYEEQDVNKVFKTTLTEARATMPARSYHLLTDTAHALRKELMADVNTFFQYTSFFRVKPLYNLSSYLAYRAGFPLAKAPVIPSIVSYLAIAFLSLFWLRSFFPLWLAAVLSLSIMIAPPMLEAARLATPDALSTVIVLGSIFMIRKQVAWHWIVLMLTVAILVRVDNVMFAAIVLVGLIKIPSSSVRPAPKLPQTAVAIVCWALLTGWIMYNASYQNGFENFYGGLSNKTEFVSIIKNAFTGLYTLQTSHLSNILAICAVLLFYRTNWRAGLNVSQYLFLVLMFYAAVRFIMFPDLTTRFFLVIYVMCVWLSLERIAEWQKGLQRE
ncbi:MAG TPA: hypothetical protein VD816_17430 [Ohtaekwangia sp.]|nr:hypothetical protein [Ohtaekwangia sp.]